MRTLLILTILSTTFVARAQETTATKQEAQSTEVPPRETPGTDTATAETPPLFHLQALFDIQMTAANLKEAEKILAQNKEVFTKQSPQKKHFLISQIISNAKYGAGGMYNNSSDDYLKFFKLLLDTDPSLLANKELGQQLVYHSILFCPPSMNTDFTEELLRRDSTLLFSEGNDSKSLFEKISDWENREYIRKILKILPENYDWTQHKNIIERLTRIQKLKITLSKKILMELESSDDIHVERSANFHELQRFYSSLDSSLFDAKAWSLSEHLGNLEIYLLSLNHIESLEKTYKPEEIREYLEGYTNFMATFCIEKSKSQLQPKLGEGSCYHIIVSQIERIKEQIAKYPLDKSFSKKLVYLERFLEKLDKEETFYELRTEAFKKKSISHEAFINWASGGSKTYWTAPFARTTEPSTPPKTRTRNRDKNANTH